MIIYIKWVSCVSKTVSDILWTDPFQVCEMGNHESVQTWWKEYNWKYVGRIAEWMSDISDSEVLVMFIMLDGEGNVRNISERLKIV